MTNNYYNVQASSYEESGALQQLLRAACSAADKDLERFDRNADDAGIESFTITVDGVQTEFILGGPQLDALIAFIDYIAGENGYAVDLKELTVTE